MVLAGRLFSTASRKTALSLLSTLYLFRPALALHCCTILTVDGGPGFKPRGSSNYILRRSLSSSGGSTSLEMAKLDSPSAQRNKEPIWEILSTRVLPLIQQDPLQVLEIAAGTGVHSHYFSLQLAHQGGKSFEWHPRYCMMSFCYLFRLIGPFPDF